MNETQGNDPSPAARHDPGGIEPGPARVPRQEAHPTMGLEAAVESGQVDLKAVVLFLACRLTDAEVELARLGRSMNRVNRRLGVLQSRMSQVESQSFEHQQSLQMVCAILRDLDDPYGFGLSVDERLAYDAPEWMPEEEG
jgi:hypothetical protein